MSNTNNEVLPIAGKVPVGRKLAFASGDVFGGGSFNIINFLFLPFLTLVVGIPMLYASPILLLTKIWDGLIDPFIGEITDAKKDNRYGKRRYFMLIFAPIMFVCFVLLFFPWNIAFTGTGSMFWKCFFVVIVYLMYATAQSFILIPYYSLASEMTDDFTERNRTNAVRLGFSIVSSLICVAVPGMIASPTKGDNGVSYIIMAVLFGAIFCISVLITALFAKEQVHTPPVRNRVSLKQFLRPLKVKTYRQYLGMQLCTSMAMAVMSSFFFIFCDYCLRRDSFLQMNIINQGYTSLQLNSGFGASRFPIATMAAAAMFLAQVAALPFNLALIKKKSKRFTYIVGACIWIALVIVMCFIPAESLGSASIIEKTKTIQGTPETIYSIVATSGTPNWLIILLGFAIGFGIGGCVFIPHSSLGDVCNVGELYFGERTEGGFSGLTNFLNAVAQALGLAVPPLILGAAGYVETKYEGLEVLQSLQNGEEFFGLTLEQFKVTPSLDGTNYQFLPLVQPESAQLAIRLVIVLFPIVLMCLGIFFATRYKLTKQKQQQIVELLKKDHETEEYKKEREEILNSL